MGLPSSQFWSWVTETPWPRSTLSPGTYSLPCRELAPSPLSFLSLPGLISSAPSHIPFSSSVLSSSSSFSIHISLQLSPLGPFFSLCPLKRVLIFPHPDPGSFTFSLPFFLPGTSVSQLPHSQPHPSPSLFPSLFPFYPMPGPTAPTDSVSDSISSSLSPTLLRSPYSSGVPSILHLCPISLVLDLPLILVSNTPFLVPSSSSLLPVFLGPQSPTIPVPITSSSYLHLPNPGSPISPRVPSLPTFAHTSLYLFSSPHLRTPSQWGPYPIS